MTGRTEASSSSDSSAPQHEQTARSTQSDQSRSSATEVPVNTNTAGRTYLFPQAGKVMWNQPTLYEAHKNAREEAGLPAHAPFASAGEWELTQILVESGISQRSTDRILKSDMVCTLIIVSTTKPGTHCHQFSRCRAAAPQDYSSFCSNRTFLETLDSESLPCPSTLWRLIEITVTGNLRDAKGHVMKEVVDCWVRDPVEVVAELLGNPTFKSSQQYAPFVQHVEELAEQLAEADEEERERVFEDFADSEWWARVQVSAQ